MGKKIKIEVDMWKISASTKEMGIKKQAQFRAKSRQYTKDTDLVGHVKDGKKTIGYVAIRKDPWKEEDQEKRKLVIKNFSEPINWRGTLEELTARSVINTIASGNPSPVFMINLHKFDKLIYMRKVFKTHSINMNIYTFEIVYDDRTDLYHIHKGRVSLGDDFDVFLNGGKRIAHVDGKVFDIGGQWDITFADDFDPPHELEQVLILFAGAVKYFDKLDDRLEDVAKKVEKGEVKIHIEAKERMLYLNPRRIKI